MGGRLFSRSALDFLKGAANPTTKISIGQSGDLAIRLAFRLWRRISQTRRLAFGSWRKSLQTRRLVLGPWNKRLQRSGRGAHFRRPGWKRTKITSLLYHASSQKRVQHELSNLRDEVDMIHNQQQAILSIVQPGSLGLEGLYADIHDIANSPWADDPDIPVRVGMLDEEGVDVNLWMRRIGPASCNFHQLLPSFVETSISKTNVFRYFAAVEICHLVFETGYPDFLAREQLLLHHYRRQISTHVGPKLLSQYDLLACKSLLSEKPFEVRLVTDANILANKLGRALDWLISPSHHQTTADAASSTADLFMSSIMPSALRLKTNLLLSPKRKY
ncbi:hypothetical protein B0H63DRAFT_88881 [Podospora didyma]|uniref:Uncharacterized protein n=1 Tax=Podospora didyma TaxID=330526 RepID=A0AAE0K1S9_9PEZI|nr:hypothetical protein B0H63DRAFT_88881 [Podospora didyma]